MKRLFNVFIIEILIILFAATPFVFAQPPDTLWTRTYGGQFDEDGWAIEESSDGNYVIAGRTESFGAGDYDVYLIKLDTDGDTIWTKTYGGSLNDGAFSIQRTTDNGYIIAGVTSSFSTGGSDVWLLKTDADGDTSWTRNYGGPTWDQGFSVQQTSDNGFIITGFSTVYGSGDQVYLIKTDDSGDTLWTKTYGGTDQDYGRSVLQTPDGGYVVAGYTFSYGVGNGDAWLIRTDSEGVILWDTTYGGNLDDRALAVLRNPDNGYILVGYTASFGTGLYDVYIIRTDSLGDTLWMRAYGGTSADVGHAVQHTTDGNLIIAGYTYSYAVGENDFYLLKMNMDGDVLWTQTYGGIFYEYGYAVKQTSDNGYLIVGRTNSFGAGENDIYAVKLGPDIGVEEQEFLHSRDVIFDVFPNPFRDKIDIRLSPEQRPEGIELKIYDAAGRLLKQFNHSTIQPFNQVTWDGTDDSNRKLPSGVYFLKYSTGEFTDIRKLLLVR
ncbi:MAG: T9SS type A sorting domain-containing protein [candidate division WOR-3 bacterium]|nr:MAG: T9SS type A sorting domain-containing protein [candidate division WOR-3 bacterium]